MIKKCMVLSIVWIILLSLTSIRVPLAQKYKGPAANDPDKNIQPRAETAIDGTSAMVLRHIALARANIRGNAPNSARYELNHGSGTAHH